MIAMANNLPEVLRMLWYWAWFRIRKVESRRFGFIGPLGPELKGEGHLRVHKYLVTLLVGTLFVLPATGQSTGPAGQSRGIGRIVRSTRAGYKFDHAGTAANNPASSPSSAPHSFHNGSVAGTPPSNLRRRTFRQSRSEWCFQRHGPVAERPHSR